jgi:hypothetical protein
MRVWRLIDGAPVRGFFFLRIAHPRDTKEISRQQSGDDRLSADSRASMRQS